MHEATTKITELREVIAAQQDTTQENIRLWREKQRKDHIPIILESTELKGEKTLNMLSKCPKDASPLDQFHASEAMQATLASILGTAGENYNSSALNQFLNAMARSNEDPAACLQAGLEGLRAMKPGDVIEAQLCGRLIVLSKQFNHFMSRAIAPDQTVEMVDINLNRTTKIGRLYNETLEALNRYRRKGEQKVTVQHVNVNNGGQAVVAGNFTQGGEKAEGAPHANQ